MSAYFNARVAAILISVLYRMLTRDLHPLANTHAERTTKIRVKDNPHSYYLLYFQNIGYLNPIVNMNYRVLFNVSSKLCNLSSIEALVLFIQSLVSVN